MDNGKTGELIRLSRKEKGLTQLELAQHLHISDRAVSKWERGLCAPDIAMLEPLGEVLGLSITELISGERKSEEAEQAAKEAIGYSQTEVRAKNRKSRTWLLVIGAVGVVLGIALLMAVAWYRGDFYILGRYPSPDGRVLTTVYSRDMSYSEPPRKGGFTLKDEGAWEGMSSYLNARFRGLWWSPNSLYQVVSMNVEGEGWEDEGGIWLSLSDYGRNVGCNLDAYLRTAMYENDFFEPVPWDGENFRRLIEFDFVQWSAADPAKMLIYFYYTDISGDFREGYFWYDYESGLISGEMEIEQEEKQSDPLHDLLT